MGRQQETMDQFQTGLEFGFRRYFYNGNSPSQLKIMSLLELR